MGLLCATIAACIAVVAGQLMSFSSAGAFVWVSVLFFCASLTFFRHAKIAIPLLVAGICVLLYSRSATIARDMEAGTAVHMAGPSTAITGIAQIPQSTEKRTKVLVNDVSIQSFNQDYSVRGSILLITPLNSPIAYGDELEVHGKFLPSSKEKNDGYKSYLLKHQIIGTLVYPTIKVANRHRGNPLIDAGWQIEQRVEQQLNYLLPQDEGGLIVGIVLGVPRSLSENLSQSLRNTGTTHIVVASGYNLSIIITLCTSFGKWLGKSKAMILALVFIGCYILISGANPSILRAAIMAGLTFTAIYFGRQKDALRLLVAAAIIMLAINPLWLYDTSFQLSFAATLGIMLFQKPFSQRLNRAPTWLSDALSTTAAAQVFVWPIIISTFGAISTISILTNVLILWTVPIIMAIGGILVLASIIWQPLALATTYIIHPLLLYTKTLIELFASVPFASVNLRFNWTLTLAYYAFVLTYLGIRSNDQTSN